jgi:hypothetical protein
VSRRQANALRPQIDPIVAQFVEATVAAALSEPSDPQARANKSADLLALRIMLDETMARVTQLTNALNAHLAADASASRLTLTRARLLRALNELEGE